MFPGLEFRHLTFFIAVAEECSFTRAAQRVHVSQPSLSQGIKQLEDGLAATLFFRGPAGVSLSPAGAALLPFARDLLQRRDEAARTANAVHQGRELPFRFGYSPFVSRGIVREVLCAYPELVPGGRIEQSSESTVSLTRMVVERRLDAALVTYPIHAENLRVQIVCKERCVVCLRADDPHASDELLSSPDVSTHLRVFVARGQNPLFFDQLQRRLRRAGIHVSSLNFVSTPADVQFQVQAGSNWGLVRASVRLEPDLITKEIEGLRLPIKTAFICHVTQDRPVLPLLAYRLAKTCQDNGALRGVRKPIHRSDSQDLRDTRRSA